MSIDWNSLLLWSIVGTCFLVGFIGTVLPILPGTVIALLGVLIHKLWMGDNSVSWTFVGLAGGLALLSLAVDLLATWWGARHFGASRRGAIGAVLGGMVGLFFGLPGLVLGPIIGAIGFELIERRPSGEATRAGMGTLIGGLLGLAAKMLCTLTIIIGFFLSLPPAA